MSELTFEDLEYYDVVVRKDGKNLKLHGTSYTVPSARVSQIKDDYTFVYMAINESGTYSYGETSYSEVSKV